MPDSGPLNLYATYSEHFPSPDSLLLETDAGEVFTYGDAERESARVANFLQGLGLQRGDRVSVQVEKSPQALWLFLGTLRAGMVFHPLNTGYTEEELHFFLSDAESSLLVCDTANEVHLQALCDAVGTPHVYTLGARGAGTLSQALNRLSTAFAAVDTLGSDIAALVYSSGTTGTPKGIMLSHGNLAANASTLVNYWAFTRDDCLLHALPIFHVHGLFVAIGCVLMSGCRMQWLSRFTVQEVLGSLPHSTVMMGVPTYYTRLLADAAFDAQVCAGMRLFISGSAPLLPETFSAFEARSGHTILERYGMTETGMNTSNPLEGERRAGTVGFPLPGVDVRICAEDGAPCAAGAVGDLQVRGENVFAGYWNLPEKTAEDFTPDGFFNTGDQASADEEGYIAIVGRSKDMVISGGLNIYPREIELLINSIPGIDESAVIGIPDADFGEALVAVVVRTEGEAAVSPEEVIEALRERIAGFKVPKTVRIVEELPRNAMGKVQKAELRGLYS